MGRPNLFIKTGTYIGNFTDNRNIAGLGFNPEVLLIKVIGQNSVVRTNLMKGDQAAFLTSSNANLNDRIQQFLYDGFQIGTSAQVNNTGFNVYYVALGGSAAQKYLKTFRYTGDGNDNRNIATLPFTPDFVLIRANAVTQAVWRLSTMTGDVSARFDAQSISETNLIQDIITNGFQIGSAAGVNISAADHFGFALKSLAGAIKVGTFTGNGVSGRAITGVGFKPDVVIVKANAAQPARILTAEMVVNTDTSAPMNNAATDAQGIISLDSDGFTVGSGTSVNGNAVASHYIALKSGQFNAPIVRATV